VHKISLTRRWLRVIRVLVCLGLAATLILSLIIETWSKGGKSYDLHIIQKLVLTAVAMWMTYFLAVAAVTFETPGPPIEFLDFSHIPSLFGVRQRDPSTGFPRSSIRGAGL